jgi:uncharacterized membrane protein YbaN (DUF454 family)
MRAETKPIGSLTAKIIAGALILVCLAVGAIGLLIPIVPGLLFLAIAAIVAAKHSATIDRLLRRNRTMSRYLDSADGFVKLSLARKLQFGALLCLKMLIDGTAFVVTQLARLLSFAVTKYRYRQSYR